MSQPVNELRAELAEEIRKLCSYHINAADRFVRAVRLLDRFENAVYDSAQANAANGDWE